MIQSRRSLRHTAFTLVELLVVITIVGLLVALASPVVLQTLQAAKLSKSLQNLRQVGGALLLYASENDASLPARVVAPPRSGKWPALIYPYLNEPTVYLDPVDAAKYKIRKEDILTGNGSNKSSYLINGFNDLGALVDPELQVSLLRIGTLSNTILLGKKYVSKGDYYMDVNEGAGNHVTVLDWTTYGRKANFFFADGSARTLLQTDYQAELWLVDKTYSLP
ncbi:MAG: prepilin-type N-terminal cleavage/methylation domain-containing protein [Blastochloris sp.]|nr:prepilin-type N-terminal cleavage/methylation domain-containing protein [Blastochloris sp.]